MKITLFIIILILALLLFDSYRRLTTISAEKNQLLLSRETISDIAYRVLNTHDPAGFYHSILESCLQLVPKARCGFIFRFNSEGLLTVWSSAGCSNEDAARIIFKPEEAFLYLATEGKLDRAVLFNHPEESVSPDILKAVAKGFGFQSEVSCPLRINGDFVGMLSVNGDQSDIFTEQDFCMLQYLAKQIDIFMKYQKQNDEILYLSKFDSLSGMMNKTAFDRETAKLLNDPSKDMETLHFVLVNLDGMKTVNSLLGSHTGDEIIRDFSEILNKHLGKNDFCGRYGGDEFAAVIRGNSVNVNHILEEAGKEFRERKKELGGKSFTPGFNYGRAVFQEGHCNLEMLYALADQKLHEMKNSRKKKR